jgi:predicted amidohydrolase
MRLLFLSLALSAVLAAQLPYRQAEFRAGKGETPSGWQTWAARQEIAPETFVSGTHSRGGAGALAIRGAGNAASSGGWERSIDGIQAGKWYHLTAWYRADGLSEEANQIVCRLEWTDASGKRKGTPDYAWKTTAEGGWRQLSLTAPAPERAAKVKVQLWLHNAPNATVWWDDIVLNEVPAPAKRDVKIASIHLRPKRSSGREENLRLFTEATDRSAPAGTDLIVFPEGMTVVGTGKPYVEVAEPVPGPSTKALGELAKRRNAYVAAGIYERDGVAVYNTAVLIDRKGEVVGKYRKVYLPREEIEAGLTAGNAYPVFDTDFGKLGLMICWDVQYADPARALAMGGAEIVLLPIWGGNETLMRARAIENHVFLVSSGYDAPTMVLDPKGETLAVASTVGSAAVATVDLNRRYEWEWLGEMRGRYMRELRLDVPMKRPLLDN